MIDNSQAAADYQERLTASLRLRYRPDSYASQHIETLAARAERVARYVDRRLSRLKAPGERFEPATLILESESSAVAGERRESVLTSLVERSARVLITPESPERELVERVVLLVLGDRFGGPETWTVPDDLTDAVAVSHVLDFLAFGLARYLADEFEQHERRRGPRQREASPRQSADQVCRQIAADRDGKLPLYECLIRGPGLVASPPEYAALAESFCGYLLERDGPKAYRRLIKGSRANVHDAAEVAYGKSLEQLQDEWMGAILRAHGRKPVPILAFTRQILPYLRPYTWLVILALMLMFLGAGVAQIAPFAIRDVIDIVSSPAARDNPNESLSRLYTKLGVLALASFVNLAALIWLVYVVHVIGQNVLRDLRLQLIGRLHHLNASFYARNRMGDMIARFTADISRMAEPLVQATAYSIYYLVFVVATIVSMVAMSWQLSLLLLLIIPIYVASARKLGPAIQVASRSRQERLAQLNSQLEEMLFGHALIKAYGLGSFMMDRFRPKILEHRKLAIWADFLRAIYKEVIGIAENLQTKLVLAVGGTLVILGQMSTGTVVGFNGLVGRFLLPLHNLGLIYASVSMASASLRRVEEVLKEPMELMDTPPGGTFGPEEVKEAISFEHVSFSYSGAKPTLVDVSVSVPAGSKVAFVGPTGAGKSTLVNLLPRFYDVDEGAVKIDGRDVRSFSLTGLRRAISIVSQDTFLFNSTILENIRFGRLEATDDEVVEAAKGARLHEFIEGLPAGYDTQVGERGARLSGGQRQRVAIARALLRGSPILILDEATSSLDAETEAEILSELDEVTQGKTVISITHRLGLAIRSDRIVVLQAGRVGQQGSHEELLHQPGLYRKLFEDQNEELVRRATEVTHRRVPAVPTFSIFPTAEVANLAHLLTTERHAAGSVLCEQNGTDGKLYLLRSGQVELVVHDEQGAGQRLQIGAPADGNGAATMSFLLNIPQSVTARAVTDTEVQVLDDDHLRTLAGVVWGAEAPHPNGDVVNGGAPPLPRSVLGRWAADRIRSSAG